MPRGGKRKGSGRRRLGKKVVPYRLEPEVDAVVWAIATIEKTSKSAALKKLITNQNFKLTPSPDFTGPHYFPDWPWVSIQLAKNPQELFRCLGTARDGGTLEYIFVAGEPIRNTFTKERVAEIAADFMTMFYHVNNAALETQELRDKPRPFWLLSFSDSTIKGPLRQMFFVVVVPDGRVVIPRVEKRL